MTSEERERLKELRAAYLTLLPKPPSGKAYEAPMFTAYEPKARDYFVALCLNAQSLIAAAERAERLETLAAAYQAAIDAGVLVVSPTAKSDDLVHHNDAIALARQALKGTP